MANKKLGYVLYVLQEDGEAVPLDSLSEEQKEELRQNITQRLSENLSGYFTQHPEEYVRLPKSCIVHEEGDKHGKQRIHAQG